MIIVKVYDVSFQNDALGHATMLSPYPTTVSYSLVKGLPLTPFSHSQLFMPSSLLEDTQ